MLWCVVFCFVWCGVLCGVVFCCVWCFVVFLLWCVVWCFVVFWCGVFVVVCGVLLCVVWCFVWCGVLFVGEAHGHQCSRGTWRRRMASRSEMVVRERTVWFDACSLVHVLALGLVLCSMLILTVRTVTDPCFRVSSTATAAREAMGDCERRHICDDLGGMHRVSCAHAQGHGMLRQQK